MRELSLRKLLILVRETKRIKNSLAFKSNALDEAKIILEAEKIYMSRIEFSKTRYFSGEIQKTQFLSMLKNQPLSRQPL